MTAMLGGLVEFLALCLLAVWIWIQWRYWRLIRVASKLPMATPGLPVLGHLHLMFYNVKDMSNLIIDYAIDMMDKGVNAATIWFGPMPMIIVYGKEDIQKVLTSSNTQEKSNEMNLILMASETMKYGSIVTSGFMWKIMRRSMNPMFHTNNLQSLIPRLNRNCQEMVANLSEHVDGDVVNLFPHTMTTALQSACHLIFGSEIVFDTKSKMFRGVLNTVTRMPALTTRRIYNPLLRYDSIFRFIYKTEVEEFHKSWETFTNHYVKLVRSRNAEKEVTNVNDASDMIEGSINMISQYSQLQKQHQLTDYDLNSEIYILYATGTDTVSVASATCLLLLAYYKDIQEKVYEEITSVVCKHDEVTIHDLTRMTYLDQVCKETLRWALIAPYVMRKPSEDVKLSTCELPKGFTVYVSLLGLLMNPKVYPDPKKFDPERFSFENCAKMDKTDFLPFSGGPRNCIAEKYAKILMKLIIINVLRSFRLTTTFDIANFRRKAHAIYSSADGYQVKLHRRA